jgi:long-chain fatty acid transport protein
VRARRGAAALCAAAVALFTATGAQAGGLYTSERGVRPLGRGGAFVAGADDLGAIAYNPAGIFDAGDQLLIDASFVLFSSEYARQALLRQVDPNTGETVATYEQTFPSVEGSGAPLPIPTIAASFSPHEDWRIALGAYAPYSVLPSYPETVENIPAPQRYSLVTLDGSLLAVVGGYVAWRPVKELRLGMGFEVLIGSFASRTYLSGCLPERFFCAPEDPRWDVAAEIQAAPIVSPSGNLGAIWEFSEGWRLGGSFHLPYWIIAPATIHTRLPVAPVFRNATQEGDSATVEFQLPWEIRLGVEMRDVVPGLRVEVGADYHHWAIQDDLTVEPDGIALTNLPGFPPKYELPSIAIQRNFQSTIAGRIGAEYDIHATPDVTVTPRLGFSYETSAVPPEYLSVLTLDTGKLMPSVGASVSFGGVRLDVVYAHQFNPAVTVPIEEGKLEQTVPISANPPDNPDYINAGYYSWNVDVIGLGFAYTFDKPKPWTPGSDAEDDAPVVPAKKPEPKPEPVVTPEPEPEPEPTPEPEPEPKPDPKKKPAKPAGPKKGG